ncbi:MAG: PKD domain-containing protein, partial [Deltaproteobacteria bacterium]|nr:PKD domain-containing protein [Deltaproteobacteria bacterium]
MSKSNATFVLAVVLSATFITACAQPEANRTGAAHIAVPARGALEAIDHVNVKVLSGATLIAQHGLTLSDGLWEITLSGLPVGTYTFQADAYAGTDETAANYTGAASGIAIVAGSTALVDILMHQTGAPISSTGPMLESITASTQTPQPGQTVTLSATATGDNVSYTWTASRGSFNSSGAPVLSGSGSPVSWYAPAGNGPVTFTVTVTDANNNSVSATFVLTVVSTTSAATIELFMPPQITALSAAEDVQAPSHFNLSLDVTPPAPSIPLTYAWTSSGCPGDSGFSDATAAEPSFSMGTPGSCTLSVTVSAAYDALGAGPYPTVSANVGISYVSITTQYAPSITLAAQTLAAANGGDTVVFDVTAEDVNSPQQTLHYAWTASDGSPTSGTDDASFTWQAPATIAPEGSTITVVVSNDSLSTTQTFTVTSASGSSPVVGVGGHVPLAICTQPATQSTGNGHAIDANGNIVFCTAQELKDSTNLVARSSTGKFALGADIDMSPFAGAGNQFQIGGGGQLLGTFDGQGFTIKGFTLDTGTTDRAALFNNLGSDSILKNLIVDGANINGGRFCGVLGGGAFISATVLNVQIMNSNVTGTKGVGAVTGL